jgi:hypothetical protein
LLKKRIEDEIQDRGKVLMRELSSDIERRVSNMHIEFEKMKRTSTELKFIVDRYLKDSETLLRNYSEEKFDSIKRHDVIFNKEEILDILIAPDGDKTFFDLKLSKREKNLMITRIDANLILITAFFNKKISEQTVEDYRFKFAKLLEFVGTRICNKAAIWCRNQGLVNFLSIHKIDMTLKGVLGKKGRSEYLEMNSLLPKESFLKGKLHTIYTAKRRVEDQRLVYNTKNNVESLEFDLHKVQLKPEVFKEYKKLKTEMVENIRVAKIYVRYYTFFKEYVDDSYIKECIKKKTNEYLGKQELHELNAQRLKLFSANKFDPYIAG